MTHLKPFLKPVPLHTLTPAARWLQRAFRSQALLGPLLFIPLGSAFSGTAATAPILKVVNSKEVSLRLTGSPQTLYGIESSRDLIQWTNWITLRTDALGEFTLRAMFAGDVAFFRASGPSLTEEVDPAEVALGERLFLETRFAQFFQANHSGDINHPLSAGDPVLDSTVTEGIPVLGAFRGQSMNCRACHLVDEQKESLGNRTYADYARRSPVPDRGDGRTTTARNSPALVNASLEREVPFFLHFDGEFPDGLSLIKGTFTGRNFGWLPVEHSLAVAHIARVIREDNGGDELGQAFGGEYRRVLAGTDPAIPTEFRLPEEFRVDVAHASDEQVLDALARLVDAYLKQLQFSRDEQGEFNGSPYDRFLERNGLPRKPDPEETPTNYARRLLQLLSRQGEWLFIQPSDGAFETHSQAFGFGAQELAGLRLFLRSPDDPTSPSGTQSAGNCAACHAPPAFTDFRFHNTGAAQQEYDRIHGTGSFEALSIPDNTQRLAAPERFLPPTAMHPSAAGIFALPPEISRPGVVDLGLWNVYGNPEHPSVQPALEEILRSTFGSFDADQMLRRSVALFKTPGLRDLGHSGPYLHTGAASTLEEVLALYQTFSEASRAGHVRNPDPELARIHLRPEDNAALAAFLRSLNEDYQ